MKLKHLVNLPWVMMQVPWVMLRLPRLPLFLWDPGETKPFDFVLFLQLGCVHIQNVRKMGRLEGVASHIW